MAGTMMSERRKTVQQHEEKRPGELAAEPLHYFPRLLVAAPVVLQPMDPVAVAVLHPLQALTLAMREVPSIPPAHARLGAMKASFASLEMARFVRRQLARSLALSDPLLLAVLPLIDALSHSGNGNSESCERSQRDEQFPHVKHSFLEGRSLPITPSACCACARPALKRF